MASIRVPGYVLKDTLDTHFHPSATIDQHVFDMLGHAIIWTCFDCDTDALGLRLFGVRNSLGHCVGAMSG